MHIKVHGKNIARSPLTTGLYARVTLVQLQLFLMIFSPFAVIIACKNGYETYWVGIFPIEIVESVGTGCWGVSSQVWQGEQTEGCQVKSETYPYPGIIVYRNVGTETSKNMLKYLLIFTLFLSLEIICFQWILSKSRTLCMLRSHAVFSLRTITQQESLFPQFIEFQEYFQIHKAFYYI